jgi:enoyl-CoA hydratase/carnithine racemase
MNALRAPTRPSPADSAPAQKGKAMLHTEVENYVATLVIDRQDRLNAMDPDTSVKMREFWEQVRTDPKIRVAIVTGAGEKSFSAGFDLKHASGGYDLDMVAVGGLTKEIHVYKPVIAAVNGLAYGGGMELMLSCDLRVAAPHATFAVPETRLGLIPGGGGCVRLPYQIPWAIANDMILRGRVLNAEEAARWGLVNEVVPADRVLDTAREWATEIAARGPIALRTAKEIVWKTRGMDPDAALRFEERFSFGVQASEDGLEGVRAFNEKRDPVYGES